MIYTGNSACVFFLKKGQIKMDRGQLVLVLGTLAICLLIIAMILLKYGIG
jgi:hypothetical protein